MNFRGDFLSLGRCDVTSLRRQVLELTEQDWSANDVRQRRFAVHRDTQSVHLIFDEDFRHSDPTYRPAFNLLEPALTPLLSHIARQFRPAGARALLKRNKTAPQGYFVRALLARLRPGGSIPEHLDRNFSLTHCHRVHVPLLTNDQVRFSVGASTRTLQEGEIWEINNRRGHSVVNGGREPRIHLIVDWVRPGERCCCGLRHRPHETCSPEACEETDFAPLPCTCLENR